MTPPPAAVPGTTAVPAPSAVPGTSVGPDSVGGTGAGGTGPSGGPGAWRTRWFSAAAIRLHVALVVSLPGTATAGWIEFRRAHAGNQLAWAYAVEWPLIGAFGAYMWWRLLRERAAPPGPMRSDAAPPPAPAASTTAAGVPGAPGAPAVADDPALEAWQRYLADLHAAEPPGGPGPR